MDDIISGVTSTGFAFNVNVTELEDDFEFVEAVSNLSDGKMGSLTHVIKMMIGEEAFLRLKEHCRNEKGKVSSKKVISEMEEIFEYKSATPKGNELKNS